MHEQRFNGEQGNRIKSAQVYIYIARKKEKTNTPNNHILDD